MTIDIVASSRVIRTLPIITIRLMMRVGTLIVETIGAWLLFFDFIVLGGRALLLGIFSWRTDGSINYFKIAKNCKNFNKQDNLAKL